MTMRGLDFEHLDSITRDLDAAEAECKRSYAIWLDACERRKRLAEMQKEEWCRMIASINGENAGPKEE